jgi:hypothetical protein
MTKRPALCSCQLNFLSVSGSLVDHHTRGVVGRLQLLVRISNSIQYPVPWLRIAPTKKDSPYKGRGSDAGSIASADEARVFECQLEHRLERMVERRIARLVFEIGNDDSHRSVRLSGPRSRGIDSAGFAASYANTSRFAACRLTIPCWTRASTPAPDLGPEMFLIPVEVGNTFLTN